MVVLAVTDKAARGDVVAAALTGVGAGEGNELGDEEAGSSETRGWVVSIAAALRRSTETVSSRPLRRILKVLSPRESTWHRPSS